MQGAVKAIRQKKTAGREGNPKGSLFIHGQEVYITSCF